jgi:streptomycin 6-kinase
MLYYLNENESNSIIKHFGVKFYEKVLKDIEIYSKKWELEILQLIDYFSVNCIFTCYSEQHGDAILKIGNPCIEVFTEYNALCEYNGRHFCNVFDSDINNGIILEEQIKPGIRLRDEKVLDKRLLAFSDLFNGLHIESANASIYPTYFEWVSKITGYMIKRDDYKELYFYMAKAKEICASLCKVYSKKVLLHGDLHHDNILLGNDNKYRIIDPKGVIGDPIFDIPRFILNEFYGVGKISFQDYRKHIEEINNYFEKNLHVPIDVINKCIFIETTMANCWNVESSEEPEMTYVIYADAMMNC